MRALSISKYKVPDDVIEWANLNVGQPQLPDTWRIVNIGFFKFVLFANESDCLACKLMFTDVYDIEVLTQEQVDQLEGLCRA